jgi:dethiobiotin synthetase
MIERIRSLRGRDLVLVEGAGGLLVRLDDEGSTVADLARELAARVIIVAAAGLGTLNATALTCEAARNRLLDCAGVVVGAWPSKPDLAALSNLDDFEAYAAAPLLGVIPAGAGAMDRSNFLRIATRGLSHPRWADVGCPPGRPVSAPFQGNEGFLS